MHATQTRYRFTAQALSLSVIGNSLHLVDEDEGVSLEAMPPRRLPDDEEDLEAILPLALSEISDLEAVRRDPRLLSLIQGLVQGLEDHFDDG